MTAFASIQLFNLLGFGVGLVLYALLLAMTLQDRAREIGNSQTRINWLLFATAVIGLFWNAGELAIFVLRDFSANTSYSILAALSHAALGFLPAVVVHSIWTNAEGKTKRLLTMTAYAISATAAVFQLQTAIFRDVAPSPLGLQILVFGYLAILAALFAFAFQQTLERKAVWATALAVFTISALHLSLPHDADSFWFIELIGHQVSLPLVVAILLQDFRFAFADLFLKRALSLFLLALAAFGLYVFVAQPLMALHQAHNPNDSHPTLILLGAWIATALAYRKIHDFAVWTVDKILLRRVDYQQLRGEIAARLSQADSVEVVLNQFCQSLQTALTASEAELHEVLVHEGEQHFPTVNSAKNAVEICLATAEAPFYHITLKKFSGGRKLLSDEIEMLTDAATLAARRIDVLRVSHERCEQEIRRQEIGKLASEAELRALRAQINPHFLFNALTTIGYLISAAPDKALDTLLKLTELLRGVLRATSEFSSLDDEIKLIKAYLEIEQARFEKRLAVEIKIDPELLKLRVPSLILQPLVENAVKHGIATKKDGGKISIAARIENSNLILEVTDTGVGVNELLLAEKKTRGIGLQNIEARLRSHFGERARLTFKSVVGKGTTATITAFLPEAQLARLKTLDLAEMR